MALYLGNEVVALPGIADQISYHTLARRLVAGHGFTFGQIWWPVTAAGEPTAHWSYLYTLYLAGLYDLIGPTPLVPRLLQAVISGALHPLLVFHISRRLFDKRAALWATGLTAFYIYFIYYGAALMTEAFYISAILASLWFALQLADRGHAAGWRPLIGLGLSLAAAVLLRQVFLLVVPLLLIWIGWQRRSELGRLLIPLALLLLAILPVTLFNYAQFGQFVLLNTNAGFAFYWGNHPIYGNEFVPILTPDMGRYQDLIPEELWVLDEAALDRELLGRGLDFIKADPLRYVRLSISRIPHYFVFWPSAQSSLISNISRVASFGLALPFMLAGLLLAVRQGLRPEQVLLLLFAGAYTLIHILTWTLIRYRLPVDAVLLPFAGLALARLMTRIRTQRGLV
jgi:4-amino-4-deoxy-L-arabinose transferase-like glycosyltransferase